MKLVDSSLMSNEEELKEERNLTAQNTPKQDNIENSKRIDNEVEDGMHSDDYIENLNFQRIVGVRQSDSCYNELPYAQMRNSYMSIRPGTGLEDTVEKAVDETVKEAVEKATEKTVEKETEKAVEQATEMRRKAICEMHASDRQRLLGELKQYVRCNRLREYFY